MTPEEQNRLDRIAVLRRKLNEINYNEPIPTDDHHRALYFRQLRKLLNLPAYTFWELFKVIPSTGQKFEQLREDLRRSCPDEVVQRLSDELGLPVIEKPLTFNIQNVTEMSEVQRAFLSYAAEHDLDIDDLKTYVAIRNMLCK